MLRKLPNLRDSYQLPVVFFAGELITNKNNFVIFLKNLKLFLGQDKMFDKKPWTKIS
jgi:hypothetical protein